MDPKILIAGIGNIFLGDDGFGVEVAHQLQERTLPQGTEVVDYGIRGFDLAFALMDPWEAVILVDAMARGGSPGSVYVVIPDSISTEEAMQQGSLEAHGMHPLNVLRMVRQMGASPPPTLLVACEPEDLGGEEGRMGLSGPVERGVEVAVKMIEEMLKDPNSLRASCGPIQPFSEAKAS